MKAKLIKTNSVYSLIYDFKDAGSTETCGILGKLSLKNCQAIELGFDLDELARKEILYNDQKREWWKQGAKYILDIFGDKKFSEEDVKKAITNFYLEEKLLTDRNLDNAIQSLQQKEWEVEIEMEKYGRCEGCLNAGIFHCAHADSCGNAIELESPKLDQEGRIILKRK